MLGTCVCVCVCVCVCPRRYTVRYGTHVARFHDHEDLKRRQFVAVSPLIVMRIPAVSCVSGCIVSGRWPASYADHIKVLINPANNSLSGPQRGSFPRGGPVPPPAPTGLSARLRAYWNGNQIDQGIDTDLL